MNKFKLTTLVDKLFITCAVFLLVFAWINFFVRNLFTTFFLSLIFSFAILFVCFYFFNHKQLKKTSRANLIKEVEKNFLAFSLLSFKDKLTLLFNILSNAYKCEKHRDKIVYLNGNKRGVVLLFFSNEKITQFELANLVSGMYKFDEIKIICKEKNPSLNLKIFKNSAIEIVSKNELFNNYFSPASTYPEATFLDNEKPHTNFRKVMRNFISKNKSKSYLFCGLFMMFSSIILPYHIYYLIFGSALLILSVCSRFEHLIFH